MFVIYVPEIRKDILKGLRYFEPFLPRGRNWKMPDYINFRLIEPHSKFNIVFILPEEQTNLQYPRSFSTRLNWIGIPKTESITEDDSATDSIVTGPGTVLVLMKFGIEKYESWYKDVIKPTVSKFGNCVRLTMDLVDWQSTMVRAVKHSDVVLVDLSHDLTDSLSENILWELNNLWLQFKEDRDYPYSDDRILFFARGLENIKSKYADFDEIYIRELNVDWLKSLPNSGRSIDDILGFKIKKYDPLNKQSVQSFKHWLEEKISPWVQNIQPVLTYDALQERIRGEMNLAENRKVLEWLTKISDRDFDGCYELLERDGILPPKIPELLAWSLITINLPNIIEIKYYWTLAKKVLPNSLDLRNYYYTLLKTDQLNSSHHLTNWIKENIWFCFNAVGKFGKLQKQEIDQLSELAKMEDNPAIREIADSTIMELLPENEKREALTKYLLNIYKRNLQ